METLKTVFVTKLRPIRGRLDLLGGNFFFIDVYNRSCRPLAVSFGTDTAFTTPSFSQDNFDTHVSYVRSFVLLGDLTCLSVWVSQDRSSLSVGYKK